MGSDVGDVAASSVPATATVVFVVIAPRLGTHALGTEAEIVVPWGVAAATPVAAAAGEYGGMSAGPRGAVVSGSVGARRRGKCDAARRRSADIVPSPSSARA